MSPSVAPGYGNPSVNHLSAQVLSSKVSVQMFLMKQKNVTVIRGSHCYLSLLLLAVSADVNPNPGPHTLEDSSTSSEASNEESTYYPCGTCQYHVTWEQKAVCCEKCYCWYHIECHRIHSKTYEELMGSSVAWKCESCGEVNYSQHAFESSIWGFGDLTTNKYHPISPGLDSTANTDFSTSHIGLPMYTSSPDKPLKPAQPFRPKKKRTLRVITVNCQSLKNKPEMLKNMADSLKPDVIIGTESWLIPDHKENGIYSAEIFPEGYKLSVARRDRQEVPHYADKPDIRGGGTFVLLKDDIIGVRQIEIETDCDIVWTKFDIVGCKSVYVGSYYRPHENDKRSLDEFEKSLEKICNRTSSHVWVGGDFNFPGYNWEKDHLKPGCNQPELTRRFLDIIADNNLTQTVKEPTLHENTLDLFLVNNPSIVYNTQVIPGISKDGHHAVYTELDISPIRQIKKPRKVHIYRKADWDGLKSHMKDFSENMLAETTEDTPVEELWQSFKTALEEAIEQYVPTKMTKSRERPPWITAEVGKLLRKQRRLFEKQKGCARASRASQHYRSMKAFTQRAIRKAYWKYIEGIVCPEESREESSAPTTNKKFWKFIKHQRQEAQGVAPLKKDGRLVNDPVGKADTLNDQFKSAFSPRNPLSLKSLCSKAVNFIKPSGEPSDTPQMPPFEITEEGVRKRLQKLNPHKAAGPDKIRPNVLKELADDISPVITRIYRASLKQGELPEEWKEARVTPVYKKGEKYMAENYRPVSLTCILCKQMEHIITSQIMLHLNTNNMLYDKQHGFRSKLSCETQLIEYSSDVLKILQDRQQCDTIVMDFSKAFDKVSHDRLIYKLDRAGIDPQTRNWIKSFLTGRSQKVVIDGEESQSIPVTSGVPQGSVLGPILFLLFIDDLPQYTKSSQVRLFADDTIVYLTITSIDDCNRLQDDLKQLEQWEQDWLMEFHPAKCNVLRITRKKSKTSFPYTLHGQVLEEVASAKYLGITISDDMTWNKHTDNMISKANKKLGFLKRNLKVKDTNLKETAYKAIVRPTLEYCSTVWDPHTQVQSRGIERVQRRAARWVTGRYHNTSSVTDMLNDLEWRDLAQRRVDSRLAMMFKITRGLVDIPIGVYVRVQRDGVHLQPIMARTNYYQFSYFPRTISDWNGLPRDTLQAQTLATFKNKVATLSHDLPY